MSFALSAAIRCVTIVSALRNSARVPAARDLHLSRACAGGGAPATKFQQEGF